MTITITFTAESGADLRRQMLDMLVDRHAVDVLANATAGWPQTDKDPGGNQPDPDVITAKGGPYELAPAGEPTEKPVERVEPVAAPKATRTRRAPVRAPVAEPEASEGPSEGAATALADEPAANGHDAAETADLIDLKTKTLETLQQAFADGKVKQVRGLLASHGKGAKTFREIGADAFPGIAQAIAQGALQ